MAYACQLFVHHQCPCVKALPTWQLLQHNLQHVQGQNSMTKSLSTAHLKWVIHNIRLCVVERMPGGIKLARTPMAASRLSLGGSPLHPSGPTLHPTALPITFQVQAITSMCHFDILPPVSALCVHCAAGALAAHSCPAIVHDSEWSASLCRTALVCMMFGHKMCHKLSRFILLFCICEKRVLHH